MSPYLRPDSQFYQIRRRRLPGYGDTGVLTTKTKSRRTAERMERLLEDLAGRALTEPKYTLLLDAVCAKKLTLPDLLKAHSRRQLSQLLRTLDDPLLSEASSRLQGARKLDRQVQRGLKQITSYSDREARISGLTSGAILAMCRRFEAAGLKRNSVRRTVLRAASLLLRHELGSAERNRIFSEIDYPAHDDTREVLLSPAEIQRLLQAAEDLGYMELRTVILMALLTSADRGVLLSGKRQSGEGRGLLVRDLRIYQEGETYSGEAYLLDRKARGRTRTVAFGDRLARELLLLASTKRPEDAVFSTRYAQLDILWQRTRSRAGLEHVRFKDLRSQTAIYAERAGIPQTVISRTMGHSDEAMTRRYQAHSAVMTAGQVAALEQTMLRTG